MGVYDYSKLRGLIREKNYTQEEIAKSIGINLSTLNQKLRGRSLFKQKEISSMCEVLDISSDEIGVYFFTP